MPTEPAFTLPKREIAPVRSKITLAVLDVLAAAHVVARREASGSIDRTADAAQQDADALTRVS